jgi:hypothetical protein
MRLQRFRMRSRNNIVQYNLVRCIEKYTQKETTDGVPERASSQIGQAPLEDGVQGAADARLGRAGQRRGRDGLDGRRAVLGLQVQVVHARVDRLLHVSALIVEQVHDERPNGAGIHRVRVVVRRDDLVLDLAATRENKADSECNERICAPK